MGTAAELPESSRRSSQADKKVLLVEDDLVSASAMTTIFRRRGFEVIHVTTVAAGMTRLADNPHIVVLDLMLPDGNGTTILRTIREQALGIRVIVTTAVHDRHILAEVAELKPEVLLQKPIDIVGLIDRMKLVN